MDAHHGEEETAAGGGGVVTLEHDGVDLLLDLFVGDDDAALGALEEQVQESETLLLANVVVVNVQVVLETGGLTERQTLDGGGGLSVSFLRGGHIVLGQDRGLLA